MAQGKVTDYFKTGGKRNRFINDELTMKQQKTAEMPTTRSAAKKLAEQLHQVDVSPPAPAPTKKTRSVRSEALKAQVKQLDEKIADVLENNNKIELAPTAKEQPEAPAVPVKKPRTTKAELKARLAQLDQKISQALEAKPVEQVASSKPVVTETTVAPAFSKFQHLLEQQKESTDQQPAVHRLPLPTRYQRLLEDFRASDSIMKMLFGRSEICTFLKLSRSVQNQTKHTFALKTLGQIKTVYPKAYDFRQEKLFIDFKNDYHLIISPCLEEIDMNEETKCREFTTMSLQRRIEKFKHTLFNMIKDLHQKFLETLGIKDVPVDKINKWHPNFELESVAEIEASELPRPPTNESIKCKTGQELLSIAKNIHSAKIQEAIKKTVEELEVKMVAKPVPVQQSDSSTSNNENLTPDELRIKTLKEKKDTTYNSLLEKIRNKEKLKALESMVANSDKEKLTVKYRNYKEAVRFLVNFFQAEKKSVLEVDKCVKKLSENSKAMLTEIECREIVTEMSTEDLKVNMFVRETGGDGKQAQRWLKMIKVRNVTYLQLDKSFEFNDLVAICDQALAKLN